MGLEGRVMWCGVDLVRSILTSIRAFFVFFSASAWTGRGAWDLRFTLGRQRFETDFRVTELL